MDLNVHEHRPPTVIGHGYADPGSRRRLHPHLLSLQDRSTGGRRTSGPIEGEEGTCGSWPGGLCRHGQRHVPPGRSVSRLVEQVPRLLLFMQFLALYAFVIFMSEVWPTKSVDWFLDYDYYGVAFHSFELGVYWLLTFIWCPWPAPRCSYLSWVCTWSSSRTSTTSDGSWIMATSTARAWSTRAKITRSCRCGRGTRCTVWWIGASAARRPRGRTSSRRTRSEASRTASAPGARPRSASRRRPSRASTTRTPRTSAGAFAEGVAARAA